MLLKQVIHYLFKLNELLKVIHFVFFRIDSLVDHPVRGHFPAQFVLRRPTRGALRLLTLDLSRCLGLEL